MPKPAMPKDRPRPPQEQPTPARTPEPTTFERARWCLERSRLFRRPPLLN